MTSGRTATIVELLNAGGLEGRCEIVSAEEAGTEPAFATARHVHAVWREMAGDGLPDHGRLDPFALGTQTLPSIVLLDVLAGGTDYRWRLFGSQHVVEYGADLTGRTLSELRQVNPSADALEELLGLVTRTAQPHYFRFIYVSKGELRREACGVMLPLCKGGPEVAVLLGATSWRR
jgi:hypothetical protein